LLREESGVGDCEQAIAETADEEEGVVGRWGRLGEGGAGVLEGDEAGCLCRVILRDERKGGRV